MRKHLVAFNPPVLDVLEALLDRICRVPHSPELDEALLEVRRAKALYRGEGPVRLMDTDK